MDAEPLISTVIPAYNVADTIVATLGSVLGQSHRNLEVLVVDDGSTDDTASLVRSVAAGDDRVRCVDQGGNRGRSAARNFGIDQAVGDWIAFVDADDLWASDRLEAMMAASRDHPRSQVLFDDRLQFTVGAGGAVTLGHRYPTRQMVRTGQVHEVDRRTWMIDRFCRMDPVVRTSLLRDHPIRYPVDLAVGEDLCFYVQLAFWPDATHPLRIGRPSYRYRMGATQRSGAAAAAWTRSMEIAVETTGSAELAELVERITPSWVWVMNRGDQLLAAEGRLGAADPGATVGAYIPTSMWRGYRRLAGWRILQDLSRIADRAERPTIIADVERQLARGMSTGNRGNDY